MTGRRPAMTRRRPGRYRGNARRLMRIGLLGCTPPAHVGASTGGGRAVEPPRYRSGRWQAAIRGGGIAVGLPLLLDFRGERPLWWDIENPIKLNAPAPAMRPNTESGCPKEPQTHDQQGEANAPHPGNVGRADLPPLDLVVHDEETLPGATPSPQVAFAREPNLARGGKGRAARKSEICPCRRLRSRARGRYGEPLP